jgi:FixJ family two-component response regulator
VKVSLKGVLIGGIVDVVSSSLMGIPLAVYALSKVDVAHTPKEQLGSAIVAVSHETPWLYGTQLLIGLACSVLGGYPRIPFVFLTGVTDPSLRQAAAREGADGFLLMPFERAELLETVRTAMGA